MRHPALALALLLLLALPAGAQASVSNPPASVPEGGKLTVTDSSGGGKAKRGVVRYYLSTDKKHDLGDVRLIGHRSAKRAKGKAAVRVPYTVPADPMFLLACTGKGCAASSKTTTVTVAAKDQSIPRTLNDQQRFDESDDDFLAQIGYSPQQCPAPAARKPPVPSLKSALAKAQAKLNRAGGKSGIAAFKKSSA